MTSLRAQLFLKTILCGSGEGLSEPIYYFTWHTVEVRPHVSISKEGGREEPVLWRPVHHTFRKNKPICEYALSCNGTSCSLFLRHTVLWYISEWCLNPGVWRLGTGIVPRVPTKLLARRRCWDAANGSHSRAIKFSPSACVPCLDIPSFCLLAAPSPQVLLCSQRLYKWFLSWTECAPAVLVCISLKI